MRPVRAAANGNRERARLVCHPAPRYDSAPRRGHAAHGRVAQLVEQGIDNPRVGCSIPSPATTSGGWNSEKPRRPAGMQAFSLSGACTAAPRQPGAANGRLGNFLPATPALTDSLALACFAHSRDACSRRPEPGPCMDQRLLVVRREHGGGTLLDCGRPLAWYPSVAAALAVAATLADASALRGGQPARVELRARHTSWLQTAGC